MKPSNEYKPPFVHDDLTFAIAILVVVLFILFISSCSLLPKFSGPEPKWAPNIYRYKKMNDRCTFYSPAIQHSIDCDEPIANDMIMIEAAELMKLGEKFNACERWR